MQARSSLFALALWSLVLLGGLSGCKTPVSTVSPANPEADTHWIEDKRVYADPSTKGVVEVIGANTAESASGLLQAQVTLHNRTDSTKSIEYRFDWVDANGIQVDSPQARWIVVHVMGKDTVRVNALAPVPGARDFTFKFKRR
jgi:uncharacterized protein YcfL